MKRTPFHQAIGFRIADEFFCTGIASVKEIIQVPLITQVPEMPDYVMGVVNLRGRVIPVLDLRRRLRFALSPLTASTRILIVESDAKLTGLLVDSATQVIRYTEEQLEPPPEIVTKAGTDYILGLIRHESLLAVLVDLAKILKREDDVLAQPTLQAFLNDTTESL